MVQKKKKRKEKENQRIQTHQTSRSLGEISVQQRRDSHTLSKGSHVLFPREISPLFHALDHCTDNNNSARIHARCYDQA